MPSPYRAIPIRIIALAAIALAASGDARAASTGELWDSAQQALEVAVRLSGEGAVRFLSWVENGYIKRPAVMIGLAGVLLLPPLMLIGALLHRRKAPPVVAVPLSTGEFAGTQAARLEIGEAGGTGSYLVLPVGRDLVQIGRQQDNDICIDDDSVQGYHAVIERTGDTGFTITDVSGLVAYGLLVNGEPRTTAALADGDTVELGNARMRFAIAA